MLFKILKKMVVSVTECEIASAFENSQDASVTCCALIEMDHLRQPTSLQVDNTTAMSFIDDILKEK